MYKVIKLFHDLQDKNHLYKPGDTFPRKGMKVNAKRLAELVGTKNKQGVPLIEKVEEAVEGTENDSTTMPERDTEK